MQKTSVEASNAQLPTSNCLRSTTNFLRSTTNCVQSGSLTDVARLLRKEESITKGLRSVLGVNQGLQRAIKAHQSGIGDERAGLTYQLVELLREMKLKFHHFGEERLERWKLQNMETAKHTIHQMTERYRHVEDESSLLHRILEQMEGMASGYGLHGGGLQQELLGIEAASQQHEQAMQTAIAQKAAETARKVTESETADVHTKQLIAEIDYFVEQAAQMRAAQIQATSKVERLRRIANSQQEEADAMAQWEGYAVDWASREVFVRKTADQGNALRKVRERNDRLELWLQELERQEVQLQAAKSVRNASKQQKPPR